MLAVWAVGGLVALAGALTYAELGAMMPDAGGPYVYIREAFGGLPAFLYAWMALASIASGALAAVAMAFAQYLQRFVDLTAVGGPLAIAAATIATLAVLNVLGVTLGAAVQNVLTAAKILALVCLIGGGALVWSRAGSPPPVADVPAPNPSLGAGLAAAFVAVLFTIGGWQQMNMVAGEIKDPGRNIPRALMIGIAIVVACYLGATAVYLHALGRDGLAASSAVAADTARVLFGSRGATLVTLAAMISILGFSHVALLANSRLVYAMALDGGFLPIAARVHSRFGTPYVAISILASWSIALLLVTRGNVGQLLSAVVFADWIFFGLGGAAVFALRRSRPDAARPYRVLGYPVLPAFFVLAALAAIASSIVSHPLMSALGMLLLGAGVLVFRSSKAGRAAKRDTA